MKTSLHLLTCAGREASLAATLASWARCDWGKETLRVFFIREPGDDAGQRVFNGFVRILEDALADDADCFLLLEDDLAFERHFRAAIECWPPLLEKKIGCASFDDPGLPMVGADPAQRCTFADSWSVFGSQARLFTRECAAWLMPLFTLGAKHHDGCD